MQYSSADSDELHLGGIIQQNTEICYYHALRAA